MPDYRVECTGQVREVYIVTADSEYEAMKNWADGELLVSEAYYVYPVSVELEEE